jgi:hypothetical protein
MSWLSLTDRVGWPGRAGRTMSWLSLTDRVGWPDRLSLTDRVGWPERVSLADWVGRPDWVSLTGRVRLMGRMSLTGRVSRAGHRALGRCWAAGRHRRPRRPEACVITSMGRGATSLASRPHRGQLGFSPPEGAGAARAVWFAGPALAAAPGVANRRGTSTSTATRVPTAASASPRYTSWMPAMIAARR